MKSSDSPQCKKEFLVIVTVAAFLSLASGPLASSASGNPSQIQYGYDPIVDPSGSGSSRTASSGSSAPVTPGERVDEATAVVAGIVDGTGGKDAKGREGNLGVPESEVGRGLAVSGGAEEVSGGSNPVLFLAILLVLSVGLAVWAVIRRRAEEDFGGAELVVRAASFVAFLVLIVLVDGSAGSILS